MSNLSNRLSAKTAFLSLASAALVICLPQIASAGEPDLPQIQAEAQRGSVQQEIALAAAYFSGRGVERDEKRAAYWYEKAANSGDPDAQEQIGFFYDAGIGVERNPARAVEWFKRAIAGGSTSAKVNLGVNYAWGLGVRKDPAFAMQLFREAAEKKNGSGACYLGLSYYFGTGAERDVAKASHWFEVGAKLHDPQAEFDLALLLLQDPNRADTKRVIKLLRESVAAGYVPAKHQLALEMIQLPNFASSPSARETVKLLEEASSQGYWKSSVVLGVLYRDGQAEPRDKEAAYYRFRIAALQGGQNAATLVAFDIRSLQSQLDQTKIAALDSMAAAWVEKHHQALEYVGIPGPDKKGFPALAVAYPAAGTHAGKAFPLSVFDSGVATDNSFHP